MGFPFNAWFQLLYIGGNILSDLEILFSQVGSQQEMLWCLAGVHMLLELETKGSGQTAVNVQDRSL